MPMKINNKTLNIYLRNITYAVTVLYIIKNKPPREISHLVRLWRVTNFPLTPSFWGNRIPTQDTLTRWCGISPCETGVH